MKTSACAFALAVACILASGLGQAQGGKAPDILSTYLVDLSAGSVTAGAIVGVSGGAITNVQTSQDLVLAIDPFTSKNSKSGLGLSITPARTAITPMSGRTYLSNDFMRLIGSATVSYAENTATISSIAYRKTGLSFDTTYYLNKKEDPVSIGYDAFISDKCKSVRGEHIGKAVDAAAKNPPDEASFKKEMGLATTADKQCVNEFIKSNTKWNASKLSLSYGAGHIKPDTTPGASRSLGTTLAASGIFGVGEKAAINVALNRTVKAVDVATLAKTPVFRDSSFAAARFSNNSADDGSLFWLAEVSNVKSSTAAAASNAFKYAVGADKRIYSGVWLEFRLGRNYTADGTTLQTTSLLGVKFSPTSTLFGR